MTIGYVILAHREPRLVARLGRLLIENQGVVAIHYDLASGPQDFALLKAELGEHASRIIWPSRVRVGWGEWSIVQATLNALKAIADSGKAVDYVHLMSGTDYPIRPLSEFQAYLERHDGTEFIECADMTSQGWVKGGLTHERYEYRHFFNWKSHAALFDRNWKMQQRFGLRRSFPAGLRPHLGSQWWTLSWSSVQAILAAGRDPRLKSFFRTVWIPDEMFIQSVVASATIGTVRAPNLTLYQFSDKGVPVVYCNDHAEYLARQPFFFARKISPYASRLRDALDEYVSGARPVSCFPDKSFGIRTKEYQRHVEKWEKPRPGIRLLGYEKDHWRGDLVYQEAPIIVVFGASHEELRAIADLLNQTGRFLCHGAIFHPDRIEFVADAPTYAGYAKDDLALRDNRRANFLRDVAQEAGEGLGVGFLAPWTMDEHIRGRMAWCAFSRNLIVRGNVIRAFREHLERKSAMAADAEIPSRDGDTGTAKASALKTAVSASTPIPAETFHKFEREYAAYYAEISATFDNAAARFKEIDLLSDNWNQGLIEFLQDAQIVPPKSSRVFATTFTKKALSSRLVPVTQWARDIPNARDLIKCIPDHGRRIAHLKDFMPAAMVEPEQPIIAILGASTEELKFVGSVLEHVGVTMLCDGAGFARPDRIEFGGSAFSYAGYDEITAVPRDGDQDKFLYEVANEARQAEGNECRMGLIVPRNVAADDVEDIAIWQNILIVRGNMLRALVEHRARMLESSIGKPNSHSHVSTAEWISPAEFKKFANEYSHYYTKMLDSCKAAQADFAEIDLMQDDWLSKLLGFVEVGNLSVDESTRDYVLWQAGLLSDPFLKIQNPVRLINTISEESRRAAHLLALKGSHSKPASIRQDIRKIKKETAQPREAVDDN